ncbi:MAG: hypothetical protein KA765_09085 [Thermoflexales bacterium]|nr:hypothetical protein [Thermoflexales bacterium]
MKRQTKHVVILFLFILAACAVPGVDSVSTPAPTLVATIEAILLPTTIPVSIIEPIPLPTTVPNQAALIKKATRTNLVDFVIDTRQLEQGVVPWWFQTRSAWYKYTSPDGAFSVLMRGGIAPEESTLKEFVNTAANGSILMELIGPAAAEVKVVQAEYLMSENQSVAYFEAPALTSGESTSEEMLKSFDVAQIMGAIAKVEVISDRRIQLNGFPGRDVLIRVATKNNPDVKIELHFRCYIVGNTVYQLLYGGSGKSAHETEARFLDSFTLHTPDR